MELFIYTNMSIFKGQDLFATSSDASLSKSLQKFDSRLWMTNNFVPRWIRSSHETPGEICSKQQFDLFEVLIHVEEDENGKINILDMGPLSIRDAAMWRNKLDIDQDYWKDKQVKTILWDVDS